MLETVKKRITLTKGDDGSVWLRPRYKDKSIYTVQEGDRAFFRINATKSVVEIECNVNVDANKIVVSFVPNDTKDLAPGIYRYEAELITSWGMHYTFLANETFILGAEIEKHISNANSNGNYGNNIPSVDGELEDEPIVDGDIQPTNPSLDYETLNHLPKVNGNTLIGDKSNEQLGIPTKTSDLDNDSDFVSDDDYVHTDNNYDDTAKDAVDALGTASTKNVPSEGNASPTEVVMGSDTRLSDSRPASDVYDWAKSSTKPSYSYSEIQNTPTLGTAAAKNATNTVTSDSTDLVESGAVKSAIDSALSSAYKHGGTKTVEELTSALLIEANQGYVYNITNDGVTTADFIEGAGKPIRAGDNVGIAKVGNVYKFDLLSGFIDTSNFVEKSSTSGLIKNDGTIDTTAYAKQNEMSVSASGDQTTIQLKSGTSATVINAHQDISGKANKSEMFITDGTGADADKATIQLKTDLSKTVLTAHQDISGKANKSEMSVTDGTDENADKTTIQLKSGTSATVLKTHQDISGKADKVSGATNGNLAGLDANGNLTDSGIAKTDVEEMQDELSTDYATVEGNPLNFTTLSAQTAKSTILSVEPIQDLHSYDKPWAGGAGKNLLPLTITDIKSANTDGTWSDNDYTYRDIVWSILTDADGNVLGINADGNAQSGLSTLYLPLTNILNGNYYFSGCPANGGSNTYNIIVYNDTTSARATKWDDTQSDTGTSTNAYEVKKANNDNLTLRCRVSNGTSVSNIVFKPMICTSTATNPAQFEPYTNNCSISGRTQIDIDGDNGEESTSPDYVISNNLTIAFGQTVYGGTLDVENGVLVVNMACVNDLSALSGWSRMALTNPIFVIEGTNIVPNGKIYNDNEMPNAKIEGFKFIKTTGQNSFATNSSDGECTFRYSNNNFYIRYDACTSKTDFLNAISGMKLVYELATPITIQLTPNIITLLEGVNNISTTGDKITLTYRDGKVATLGDLTSAMDNLDSKIDESKILTDTATGDKYILVVSNGVLDIQQVSN